ncbi:hypothetical protein E0L36_04035 [Streptomyces sp. AJS327]|uniref:hypothetical protein n=1 Tax=Streptomyces sp. AJS327 TaxID=2545265 RepID=UPI0015E03459|nr:hypothetical protein [Streptomyces sp. AJS327]MBA0050097.1 hypothetical protein [Streptomyces sp. AJS327]
MMRNLTRAVATAGLAVGLAVGVAPAASANSHDRPVNVYFVYGDSVFANERGPGDLAVPFVKNSRHVGQSTQNESIKTGNIKTKVHGKHNRVPVEVEGSEQDQVRSR